MNIVCLWVLLCRLLISLKAVEDMRSAFIFRKVENQILCEPALISFPNCAIDNLTRQLLNRMEILEATNARLVSTIEEIQKNKKGKITFLTR